jgi:hypothetical protein
MPQIENLYLDRKKFQYYIVGDQSESIFGMRTARGLRNGESNNEGGSMKRAAQPKKTNSESGDDRGAVPIKQLTLRLPADLHRALKIRVAEDEVSMGEVIEGLIREYLAKGSRP